ncbi:MAG: porphobilinogen synthase [Gemmatimonadetes bacterium]|nr:porphobilinogen synthase [Gemmatimonadota bacterium]
MAFPVHRLRRLRRTESLRRMVGETRLSVDDLIYPLFICPGEGVRAPVDSMPGVERLSVDQGAEVCREVSDLGIPAVMLFGIPEHKDAYGGGAYADDGIVQRAIRAIKQATPELTVIGDVCLCEYTDHGHCGVIKEDDVANDPTLRLLVRTALSQAKAGADLVAPSDMMDGRVGAIREALDGEQLTHIPIMAYSAKYASAYYGPFRDAADSVPQFGDRRSYQMDPANSNEALREVELDLEEGADIVMVKPALAYLDVIHRVKSTFEVPVAAYNVSGEYAMIKAAGQMGWIDEDQVVLESLTAIKRAGADMILTYFAREVARGLRTE